MISVPEKEATEYLHPCCWSVCNKCCSRWESFYGHIWISINFNVAFWVIYFTIKFQLFSVNKNCCFHEGSFCWLFYILIVLILKYSVSFLLFSMSKFKLIILWNCFIEPVDLKANLTIWFDWVSMKVNIK